MYSDKNNKLYYCGGFNRHDTQMSAKTSNLVSKEHGA